MPTYVGFFFWTKTNRNPDDFNLDIICYEIYYSSGLRSDDQTHLGPGQKDSMKI